MKGSLLLEDRLDAKAACSSRTRRGNALDPSGSTLARKGGSEERWATVDQRFDREAGCGKKTPAAESNAVRRSEGRHREMPVFPTFEALP